MPLTLGIDCALRWINLGLADGGELYGEEGVNTGAKQSETLPRTVADFLSRYRRSWDDLERIAVTIGPGYYTGIRVGLSYATALAESLSIPLIPVGTLEALAVPFLHSRLTVVPVIKARRGAVYAAAYRDDDVLLRPSFCEIDDLFRHLQHLPADRLVVGTAPHLEELGDLGAAVVPRTASLGLDLLLAARRIAPADPATVRADYLRKPD